MSTGADCARARLQMQPPAGYDAYGNPVLPLSPWFWPSRSREHKCECVANFFARFNPSSSVLWLQSLGRPRLIPSEALGRRELRRALQNTPSSSLVTLGASRTRAPSIHALRPNPGWIRSTAAWIRRTATCTCPTYCAGRDSSRHPGTLPALPPDEHLEKETMVTCGPPYLDHSGRLNEST